jgi:hypothetical protein
MPEVTPNQDYFRLIYRNDDRWQALYQSLASLMATQALKA